MSLVSLDCGLISTAKLALCGIAADYIFQSGGGLLVVAANIHKGRWFS